MKKLIVLYAIFFFVKTLFCYEEPIFHVNNRNAGVNYTVKDFYVYNYSDLFLKGYARLYYSGTNYPQYVNMTISIFKNGSLVGSKKAYAEYETYGSSGMLPGTETYLNYYIDKVDFDSVFFNVSYSSFGNDAPLFNKAAITVTNTVISPFSGSTKKISGIVKNLSESTLKYPSIFLCLYKENKMLQYKKTYADAPDNNLEPNQTATFYTYMDLPVSYDSIIYVPNYSVSLTGPVIISSVARDTYNEIPNNYFLSINYPNPFNLTTTIEFFLPIEVYTMLKIFDMRGREVSIPINGIHAAGYHTIRWNASGLPSGVYYYSLEAGAFKAVKRALLLK
jgi:hypothetical protein